MGIRMKPGPYRMSQENLLPKFPPAPKDGGLPDPRPVREQVLETREVPAVIPAGARGCSCGGAASPGPGPGQAASRQRPAGASRLHERVARALARVSGRARGKRDQKVGRPVQTELSLDTIKVVRNDLTDCDGEAGPGEVVRGGRGRNGSASLRPLGMVWNRLSARLLRQAVREFDLVQKERGKLLTQAGSGGGGSRGA